MNELHDLLARTTDRVENPRLEYAALQIARRRRTRRRGAAAATVASALVVTVILGVQGLDRGGSPQPAAPTNTTPTPTPTTSTQGDREDLALPRGEDVVDDPDAELVDMAMSPADADVRVGVWKTCLDAACGSIAIAMSVTTDGFETRAIPKQVWRTTPIVTVAPSGDALVVSFSNQLSLEIVRPDGSVSEVRRTGAPSAVMPGELVGGVLYGQQTTYYATDTETAIAHPVPVPGQTNQLQQLPSGQLRATALTRTYAWSDDGGASWQQSAGASNGTTLQILADSAPDVHVLVGGSDGATLFPFDEVRRLEDQDSWSVIEQPAGERAYLGDAAVLPDGRLLLDVEGWSDDRPGGLYASDGSNWVSFARVVTGAPFDGKPADIRVVDMRVEQDASTIIAVSPDGRVAWFSEDVGATWEVLAAR